ncbi:uncharacterized protein LOC122510183 [Leptopilina heterotoma]|uniref:uncharacterized protein LOC122510183 n=1 Tax=Leptopilina heterotoma TaxID=63436 RepID=UPI001CA88836|nr:uncharacterized protein LOC122510183 [Leptopilina heterotoma]
MWTPYDINYRPFYILSCVHEGAAAILSACVTSSVETLALVIILQLCSQYDILIHRLNYLSKISAINHQLQFSTLHYEEKIIKDVVQLHTHMFSIGENLNKLFGSMISVQFFSSMISIGSATYQLTKISQDDLKYWILIFLLMCTLLQMFLYSYFGEKIRSKVVKSTYTAYNLLKGF